MIAFNDLATQYARLEPGISQALHNVMRHGRFIMGPEVAALEEQLADVAGVRHAVTCASGTDALLLALMAKGVGPGDAVFTTPFSFVATAEVISLLGATPVFVDIAPDTFTLDPDKLATALEQVHSQGRLVPRGVIPVDLYGLPADYQGVNSLAARHGLFVVEDAAQSFGAECGGKKACGLAELAATSFFPAKPLGCYGDGGAVFTSDDNLAETLRSLRVHGKGAHKYDNVRTGLNSRLDTMQAAILLQKLAIFPEELEQRQTVAAAYARRLQGCEGIVLPRVPQGCRSAWAQYTIRTEQRDALQHALKARGIPTAVYYPLSLHLQTAFKHLGYQPGDMPVAEACSRQVLSLPMHPYLGEDELQAIATALHEESCAL